MITKKLQQVWAFVLALVLMLVALSGGLLTTRFAHAEENAQAQSVTVNFDFDSLAGKGNFADHVWVYQWENSGNFTTSAQRISKDKKYVTIKPLGAETTVNFIVYIGNFKGSNIDVWNRFSNGELAQTDDINATPGSSYNVTYDNLHKDAQHLPRPLADNAIYTPTFDVPSEVEQGQTFSLPAPKFVSLNGVELTSPANGVAKFEIISNTNGLNATIDTNGIVTIHPDYTITQGTHTVSIKVTYKDGTFDTVGINFPIVAAKIMELIYGPHPISVEQGKTVTVTANAKLENLLVNMPQGSMFSLTSAPHSAIKINPTTGEITVAPAIDAQTGTYKLHVKATYKGNLIAQGDAIVIITPQEESSASPSAAWRFSYDKLTVTQNETQSVDVTASLFGKKTSLPHDITFSTGENTHKWVTVDSKTGTVTAKPDEFVAAQDYTFKMVVTHLDDTVTLAPVTITVTKAPAGDLDTTAWKFSYNKLTVAQNESQSVNVTASLFGKKSSLPAGITFTPGTDMPSWITVDPKTGKVTATPDEYVAAQDHTFTVAVTHLNGEVTTVPVKITITKADNAPELKSQLWKLSYADTTVQQLKSASVDLTATLFGKERALPRAVTFAKGADMPSWITVDPKTGEVTANPDEYVAAQDYEFTVVVTHLDGEVTTVPVKITITKADNAPELKSQLWKLSYADTTVQQLKSASVDLTATLFGKERALPRAVTFAKGADMPSWVMVDEKTGTITVKPSEYVELKDYVFHVVVTHLDGKTEKVAVKIKVIEADPETTYPLTPLKPGKHTIPALELTPAQPNAKPQAPKPVETPSTGLAKTGISLTGLAGLALISTLTGATIARRRHAN
ncbi:Putative Ig domain-containing protein [Arcanobacterium phocae]|uniref:Putative Ig domain-containing protein n=1 Tax=Arcanobacterium phocae TaxID=131112 RepID=A0A1H2LET2_9ACTO|nr:Rib/alpha-like domain-containing protein [Arcanobacterium phocae]SDU79530.1 Putative Ig domain-containing protein [Arcanobacterium phocae]